MNNPYGVPEPTDKEYARHAELEELIEKRNMEVSELYKELNYLDDKIETYNNVQAALDE